MVVRSLREQLRAQEAAVAEARRLKEQATCVGQGRGAVLPCRASLLLLWGCRRHWRTVRQDHLQSGPHTVCSFLLALCTRSNVHVLREQLEAAEARARRGEELLAGTEGLQVKVAEESSLAPRPLLPLP